jgi:hypothetical protein
MLFQPNGLTLKIDYPLKLNPLRCGFIRAG